MTWLASLLLALCALSAPASANWAESPGLWQERYFWDALLTARDRLARGQSDPMMIPVLKGIAGQAAQQVANLQQIGSYVKAQQDNLRFAFSQDDPRPSLTTIGSNFETLTKGAHQVRQNLYLLTARCRIASSQALPDSEMYQTTLAILTHVQQLQLQLNAVYLDTVECRRLVLENKWGTDKHFRHQTELMTNAVVRVQDSVFSVYNSGYELAMRTR